MLLHASGIKVNTTGENDASALHWAIKMNMTDTAHKLLDMEGTTITIIIITIIITTLNNNDIGINVNIATSRVAHFVTPCIPPGYTPLMMCACGGNAEILKRLLTFPSIDINQKSLSFESALTLALNNNNLLCAQLLLEDDRINVNGDDQLGQRPLSRAAFGLGHNESLPDSPLILACSRGFISIVENLLQKPDLDINRRGEQGNTALMMAVRNQHVKIVSMLLDFTGKVPSATSESSASIITPDDSAIAEATAAARRIDLDIRNFNGETAIDISLNTANEEITTLLLSRGIPATPRSDGNQNVVGNQGLSLPFNRNPVAAPLNNPFNRPHTTFNPNPGLQHSGLGRGLNFPSFPNSGGGSATQSNTDYYGISEMHATDVTGEIALCEAIFNTQGQQLQFGDDGVTLYCGKSFRPQGQFRTACSARSNCKDCRQIQSERQSKAPVLETSGALERKKTTGLYQLLRSSAPFVLKVILEEGAVVRSSEDIDSSLVVRTIPMGAVVDAFEERRYSNYNRYRTSDGWISDRERWGSCRQILEKLRTGPVSSSSSPSQSSTNHGPTPQQVVNILAQSTAPFVLRIVLPEGAVVRSSVDIDHSIIVSNNIPSGSIVDAFECSLFDGYRRYRVNNGWISDRERFGGRQIVEILKGGSPNGVAPFSLRIISTQGAVVRDGVDIDASNVVRTLAVDTIVDAYEDSGIFEAGHSYRRYRISDGWISDRERFGGQQIIEILRGQRSDTIRGISLSAPFDIGPIRKKGVKKDKKSSEN